MARKNKLFLLFVLTTTPALVWGRKNVDVVVLKNGDKITGQIKGLDDGILRVDLDYVDGTLSIDWLKVAHIESPQLFLIQTQNGTVYTGSIETADSALGQPLKIKVIETPETNTPLDQAQVVKVEQTDQSFWKRVTAEFTTGSAFTKGNNNTQYNIGAGLDYRRERWGIQADYNSNLSASSGAETANRNQTSLSALRFMRTSSYFYSGFAGFLQSSVQGIDLQSNVGGGIGHFFKRTNRTRISLLGGVLFQRTRYEPTIATTNEQNVYAGVIRAQVSAFVFKKTNLDFTATMMPAFSDPGRIYYNTNASFYLKFFKDFSWNLSFYGNWDTRPPPHFHGSDYGYTSGLKWTFNK
jgi:hypothetical protein